MSSLFQQKTNLIQCNLECILNAIYFQDPMDMFAVTLWQNDLFFCYHSLPPVGEQGETTVC